MKKIIIARSILHAIGGQNTVFGRGSITAYAARTSEEILNIHGARKADMIITEADLPLMGGARLCEEVRKNPQLRNVSIIVVCDTEESQTRCRQANANAVIFKPVDPLRLYSLISELLVIPQRKELRALLRASVAGTEENPSFFGMTRNISLSGLLLETDRSLRPGERFACTINVGRREISVACEVVRSVKARGRFLCGVKFLNPGTKSLIIIEQYIKGGIRRS